MPSHAAKPTGVVTAELQGRWWALWIADLLRVQAVPVYRKFDAGAEGRTRMPDGAPALEAGASTSSATPANQEDTA